MGLQAFTTAGSEPEGDPVSGGTTLELGLYADAGLRRLGAADVGDDHLPQKPDHTAQKNRSHHDEGSNTDFFR